MKFPEKWPNMMGQMKYCSIKLVSDREEKNRKESRE